jgi:hypothetical protein
MSRARHVSGRREVHRGVWGRGLKERDRLEALVVGVIIILKWV